MPMELLRELADRRLPHTLTDPADIDKLIVLRAAGMVAAFVPATGNDGTLRGPARVLAITPDGQAALRKDSVPN